MEPWYNLPKLHHDLFGREYDQVIPMFDLLRGHHRNRVKRVLSDDYGEVGKGPGKAEFGCGLLSGLLLPLTGQPFPPIAFTQVLLLLGFGVFWLVTALWVTMYGVTHLEASRSAVLLVVELAVAVVSAMIIGGERLSIVGWAGAALITTAALIESRIGNSPNPTEKLESAKQ